MKKILVIGEYARIIVPVFNKIFKFNQKKEVLEYEKPGVRKER